MSGDMGVVSRIKSCCSLACLCLLLSACASVDPAHELPTAKNVDLTGYVGTWHEIARLPMWAQRQCIKSTAEYWLLESGDVGVRNSCITAYEDRKTATGVATVVDPVHHAKLNVVFDHWAAKVMSVFTSSDRGNYWILRVDPEYRFAVVGTPDRDYLWILARNSRLDESTYQELVRFSQSLGFSTDDLIRARP